MKKTLSWMLALVMLFCALVCIIPVYTLAADEPPTSGQCGDDVWYVYDSNTDILTIYGTGPMWDFFYDGWHAYTPFERYRHIAIEDGVTSVGDYAFWDSDLESISLPESLESIGERAFYWCQLAKIVISKNVQFIGKNAFTYSEIQELHVEPQNNWFRSIDGVLFTADMKTLLAYPVASQTKHYTVPKGVEIIAESAFCAIDHDTLETISFPDSLRIIEKYAFLSQRVLRDVRLPPKLEHVGDWSFFAVDSFACIEFPATMTEIEGEVFLLFEEVSEMFFLGPPPYFW